MTHLKTLIAAAVTAATVGLGTAHAATVNASVSDDRSALPDGSGNATSLRPQDEIYLRTFGASTAWRSAIEFDLSGVGLGVTVTSAVLGLRDGGTSTDGRIDVYGYAADGTVTLGDFSQTGTVVSSFIITNANGTENFALDVTSFLQSLVAASASHAGFLLVSEDETTFVVGGSDICSSEGDGSPSVPGCSGGGPSLTIETQTAVVPLPAGLPLLIAGLGALGLVQRRKG